jgi:MFS family permease
MSSRNDRMSPLERRATGTLASIYGLRMLGLFLILPVFAVYAERLPGGDDHALVGLALGVYGLTQALLQLPFGMASDRLGRKRVIYAGLALFALGSFIAAVSHDIYWVIVGRSLQGAGAINAAVTALLADLTREEHRTKAMALIGGSIGLTFAASLVLGPALYQLVSIPGIFALTGALALAALAVVRYTVPAPAASHFHSDAEPVPARLLDVLRDPELARLNLGIFVLHAVLMAMFVVVPFGLRDAGGLDAHDHWQVYLPVLAVSVVPLLPLIIYSERRAWHKPVFLGAIALLAVAELALVPGIRHFWGIVLALTVFFTAFNLLEAMLPSLVTKIAPARSKGTAMGLYNTAQSLGLFAGGAFGGALSHVSGATGVFLAGAALSVLWLAFAVGMRRPPAVRSLMYHLPALDHAQARLLEQRLAALPGVAEAAVLADERQATLKVDMRAFDERALHALLVSN